MLTQPAYFAAHASNDFQRFKKTIFNDLSINELLVPIFPPISGLLTHARTTHTNIHTHFNRHIPEECCTGDKTGWNTAALSSSGPRAACALYRPRSALHLDVVDKTTDAASRCWLKMGSGRKRSEEDLSPQKVLSRLNLLRKKNLQSRKCFSLLCSMYNNK